jgi:hypothetical protein
VFPKGRAECWFIIDINDNYEDSNNNNNNNNNNNKNNNNNNETVRASKVQGGSNMTGTNCDLFTHK